MANRQKVRPIKKSNLLILLFIIAVLAFLALKGPDENAVLAEAPAVVVLTVSETTAGEAVWSEIIKATGPVAAWQEAIIGAEISGQRLVEVMADVGDTVKKGDILARFNTETLKAEYEELKANWIATNSNQRRALALKGSGAMSDQAIDDYVNQAAAAKAQMDGKALQLKYADIVAVDDGVISSRSAMLGAVCSAGDELFRLFRQNRLEWRGELTPEQAVRVSPGQFVELELPNGHTAKGSIRRIAPSFNSDTRMTTIFADIEPGSSARSGMYAKGEITLGRGNAVSVPAKSVVIRDGHNYVFIIHNGASGATVSRQEVQVGQVKDNKAQILSGISNGARIVLQGAGFLNDGDAVRVSSRKGSEQ